MPRKPRIEYKGALYHTIARGNQGQDVFRDKEDRKEYLSRLEFYKNKFSFRLYAYVLMSSHVHLLLESGDVSLSKIMQAVQFTYAQYFNRKYHLKGHLFQGRYKAILCDKDSYLLELVRYIHLNPVRAKVVDDPAAYPWSSHPIYLGLKESGVAEEAFVLSQFAKRKGDAIRRYKEFIEEALERGHESSFYRTREGCLGNDEFVEEVAKRREAEVGVILKHSLDEIVDVVSGIFGIPCEAILRKSSNRREAFARAIFSYLSVRFCNKRIIEVADYLSKDSSTITKAIRKVDEAADEQTKEIIRKARKMLKA